MWVGKTVLGLRIGASVADVTFAPRFKIFNHKTEAAASISPPILGSDSRFASSRFSRLHYNAIYFFPLSLHLSCLCCEVVASH